MSGFEWDKDIGKAKLLPNKTTQLYNDCVDELIPRLDQRRIWSRCINAYNPNLAGVMRPELQTEHAFIKFQRQFVLVLDEKKDVWRLCFVRDLRKPKTPKSKNAGAEASGGDTPSEQPGGADLRDIADHIEPLLRHVRIAIARAAWLIRDEAERRIARTPWLARLLRRQRRASLSQLMRDDVVRIRTRACARLERRSIALSGQRIELSSFIPWERFIFGKTLEQELLFADAGV
jgi:hypothetical protein